MIWVSAGTAEQWGWGGFIDRKAYRTEQPLTKQMRLDGGHKKTAWKNAQEIWVGTMAQAPSQSSLAIQKSKRKLQTKNAVGSEA